MCPSTYGRQLCKNIHFLHIRMCSDLLFLPELCKKKKKRMSVCDYWRLHQERVIVFTQLKREEVRISCLLIFITIIAFRHMMWFWTEGQLIAETLSLPMNQSQRRTNRRNRLKLNLVYLYAYRAPGTESWLWDPPLLCCLTAVHMQQLRRRSS